MGRFTSMLLGSILVLFSLAAFTHGQESSEQNINILRKVKNFLVFSLFQLFQRFSKIIQIALKGKTEVIYF